MPTMGSWTRARRSLAAVAVLLTNVGLLQAAGVQPAQAVTTSLVFAEGFDKVAPPALPAGWTATRVQGATADHTWETSTPSLTSDPNAASVGVHGHATDMVLDSVPFTAGPTTRVRFFQKYNMQATTGQFGGDSLDGGVLEIKIGTAGYVDFQAAGGVFNAGEAPSRKIAQGLGNPLAGRMAWSGISAGATHNGTLPSSASGKTVQLRWRLGTSNHNANQGGATYFQSQGWIIDSVEVFTDSPAADQTISFTSPAPTNAHVGDTYSPTVAATSGLPVTLSIAASSSSVCALRAGTFVDFHAIGSCVIQANQAGNNSYNPAPQQTQTVNVVKFTDTISFTSTAPVNAQVGSTYTPTAITTYGRTVNFSIAAGSSSVCSIGANNLVTFNAVGSCVIQADQPGDADFAPATQVTQTVNVVGSNKTDQTISFTSSAPVNPQAFTTYTPTATATSSLPVTFAIAPGSVCSLAGGVVTFETPGPCTIQADQAGNGSFNAAPQVSQSMTVVKADQTVYFTSTAPQNPQVGTTYTPTAATSSGGPLTLSIAAGSTSVCSIDAANLVTFNAPGSCVIQADQAGNANLNPGQVTQSVNVVAAAPSNQTISFTSTAPVNPAVGATYTPTATATSGLPVTFSIAAGSSSVCSIGALNLVTFNATGSCVIQANQAGNGSFNAAPQVTQSVNVVPAPAPPGFVTSFTPSNLRNDFDGWVGMRLTVGSVDLNVSALGRWVVAGNSGSHAVRLVKADGTDVPGASAVVNTAGAPAGDWKYTSITPVTLSAGATYYLLSGESASGDSWYDYDTHVVTSGAGTDVGAAYAYAATPSGVVPSGSTGYSYGVPNFRFTAGPATPAVTVQPVSQTGVVGGTATFSAAASGLPAPTVKWQVKVPGGGFVDLSGATSTTLTLSGLTLAQSGNQYRAVFTNSSGTATSDPASLTVNALTTPLVTSFTPSSVRNDFDGWVGMRLTVGSADLKVSALGRWVVAGNSGTHLVRLVNADGTDVPGASAAVNTAGAPAGDWKYASIAPVTLSAGATYYLLSGESAGGDSWYDYDTHVVTSGAGTDVGAGYAYAATPSGVVPSGSTGYSYGVPNLLYGPA